MPLLELSDVTAGYGDVPAINGITLRVGRREIVALLGPNGAGKTTTLRTIAGLLPPTTGTVAIDGQPVNDLAPERRARLAVQFIPEGGGVLRSLSVGENLRLAAWRMAGHRRAPLPTRLRRAFDLFPILDSRQRQPAATLSGGERQMLALAQVMMTDARLVLIDEASLGLAPRLATSLFQVIVQLRHDGRSILLVEQNAHAALAIADRAYVMEKGRIARSGTRSDLARDDLALTYLGAPNPE